ncbi:heme exporter protein CcmD [Amorphus sp. 3PC139-8]|uniref:heme exporter protein CcmD n=1 Tax=Amorphus sp. 3PC139-8 TaxID=2735676 RepID=UPI00345D7E85
MGDPHLGFIVAAYAVTVAVIAVLIGWILLDGRRLKRQLARLEARGYGGRRARAGGGK